LNSYEGETHGQLRPIYYAFILFVHYVERTNKGPDYEAQIH